MAGALVHETLIFKQSCGEFFSGERIKKTYIDHRFCGQFYIFRVSVVIKNNHFFSFSKRLPLKNPLLKFKIGFCSDEDREGARKSDQNAPKDLPAGKILHAADNDQCWRQTVFTIPTSTSR